MELSPVSQINQLFFPHPWNLLYHQGKQSLSFLSFFFNCVKFLGANFYLFIIFWPCCVACRILVPQPGIKPVPPAVEAPSLNHWTGEVGGTGWSPRTSLFCPHSLAKNVWLTDLMLYPPAELEKS